MRYISPLMTWQSKESEEILRNGKIWIGRLSASSTRSITVQLGAVLLECYIDPRELVSMALDNRLPPGELLRENILPDEAKIKVGDFGEILARSVMIERKDNPRIPTFRWRFKAHKNDTVRGPDLIGYVIEGEQPSEKDFLILSEVKTRARSIKKKIVEDALTDVRKHYVSNLANSLFFTQRWLRLQGQEEEAKTYARFSNPYKNPYQRKLVPCVVHESRNWDDKFLEVLPVEYIPTGEYKTGESIEVIIICIENLPNWIDQVHLAAIDCAGK